MPGCAVVQGIWSLPGSLQELVAVIAGQVPMSSASRAGHDDLRGDGVEIVGLADALDLGEQAVDEAKVAARDAGDGGDRDGVSRWTRTDGRALPGGRTT